MIYLFQYRKQEFKRQKILSGWRLKNGGGYSHQFFDNATLDYLEEKEQIWNSYLQSKENNIENVNGI